MVFFTCNHCGESVKKPAVEKHYNTRCRGAPKYVSCMDCQKDFRNEEYVAHTKCISELQKYSGKNYVAKESSNSGAKKQESWMDIVRSILETREYNLSNGARNALQKLQGVDNVPRKKAKFQNFVGNCMRMQKAQSEEIWNVLEKELEKMKLAKQQETAATKAAQLAAKQQAAATNGVKRAATPEGATNGNDEPAKKKTKKQKPAENGDEPAAELQPNAGAVAVAVAVDDDDGTEFQWTAVLEKLVAKNCDGITLDKLKKKLLKKYRCKLAVDALTEKQQKKFEKKFAKNLKKCPAVQVDGELAKPC